MSMDVCISERRPNEHFGERRRWHFSTVAVLVAALGSLATAASKPLENVTDIRFWAAGDTTRVAIEVSGEFHYKAQRLSGPDRVFFDIEDAKLALKDKKATTIPVGDGLVKQVRIGEKQPGTIRVVLDLERNVDYSVSQLSNPERLMVELSPKVKVPASEAKPALSSSASPAASKLTSSSSKASAPKPVAAPPVAAPQIATPEAAPIRTVPQASSPAGKLPAQKEVESQVSDTQLSMMIPPVFASIAGSSSAPSTVANIVAAPVIRSAPEPLPEVEIAPVKEPKLKEPTKTATTAPLMGEPQPAARNSNGERSLTRVLGLKLGRVVLDAGHGGHDQGTHSKSGMLEKDLVLDVTNRLAELLRERMGTEVILTRSDDTYLTLEERTRLANEAKADLFLSIHANSSPVKSVAGVETFYLNFSTGRDDLDLATRENASSQRSIADLKEVVSKIALRAKVDESREFAMRVQNSLHSTAVKQNKEAKDRGVKRAPFVVLIGADMPSVLAEIGFLSNSRDEALLKGEAHRERIAEALYNGIAGYAESLSRTTVATASGR